MRVDDDDKVSVRPYVSNAKAYLAAVLFRPLRRHGHGHAQLALAAAILAIHLGELLGFNAAAQQRVKLLGARGHAESACKVVLRCPCESTARTLGAL